MKRKLVTTPIGPVDKRRRKRGLTVAVKTAIDAMIFDRCTRAEACERAGFTERALYLAREKVEVATYFNKALQVLRAGERPQNIHRLCAIRDAADNMPAVNAIKTLEQLDAEAAVRPNAANVLPGVTIRIVNQIAPSASPPTIDITPAARPLPQPIDAEPIFKPP